MSYPQLGYQKVLDNESWVIDREATLVKESIDNQTDHKGTNHIFCRQTWI